MSCACIPGIALILCSPMNVVYTQQHKQKSSLISNGGTVALLYFLISLPHYIELIAICCLVILQCFPFTLLHFLAMTLSSWSMQDIQIYSQKSWLLYLGTTVCLYLLCYISQLMYFIKKDVLFVSNSLLASHWKTFQVWQCLQSCWLSLVSEKEIFPLLPASLHYESVHKLIQ